MLSLADFQVEISTNPFDSLKDIDISSVSDTSTSFGGIMRDISQLLIVVGLAGVLITLSAYLILTAFYTKKMSADVKDTIVKKLLLLGLLFCAALVLGALKEVLGGIMGI